LTDSFFMEQKFTDTKTHEIGVVFSFILKKNNRESALAKLDELISLADTAGVEIVDKFHQELLKANRTTLIGKGKVEELAEYILENKIDVAIFDNDLSPMQQRNLAEMLKCKVIDRSGLIIDIFVKRAQSNEAKIQISLAQLKYLLPRLTGMWTHLSKQSGGVGTRGPGETQIETDRRIIKEKISHLTDKLEVIAKQSLQQRKGRENILKFALVGYTNSGKSTLMKQITAADVYVKDELFATIDTTTRAFKLLNGQDALLSDTVGFIRDLPAHLIASFRSTLAEVKEADYLLHIVDVSDPDFANKIIVVNDTLKSLHIEEKKIIMVFNKIDKLESDEYFLNSLKTEYEDSVFISATKGSHLEDLHKLMQQKFDEQSVISKIFLKYSEMSLVSFIFKYAEVLEQKDTDTGSEFLVKIKPINQDIFDSKLGKMKIVE
jgi:GTP-binding protein HflX